MNAMRNPFKELDDSEYASFRKNVLRVKGSNRQVQFLRAVRDTDAFLALVKTIATQGVASAELASEPMTESEFKDPPTSTEQALFTAWSALTPAVACRSTFWANLTIEHIRAGYIESAYLAANGGNLPGGAERIDFVLGQEGAKQPKQIDDCVRTVLRRLGGLREIRGNRSVYVDCPLARAWWRERIVTLAARGDTEVAASVRFVLRTNQTYWEKFIDRIVFRNSTFGSDNVRGAFLRALARRADTDTATNVANPKFLQQLCRRMTTYQGARELSVLDDAELDTLTDSVIADTERGYNVA